MSYSKDPIKKPLTFLSKEESSIAVQTFKSILPQILITPFRYSKLLLGKGIKQDSVKTRLKTRSNRVRVIRKYERRALPPTKQTINQQPKPVLPQKPILHISS